MGKWSVWIVLVFLALSIYSFPLGAQTPVDGPIYRLVAQAPAATAMTGDALSKAVKEVSDRVLNPRAGDAVLDLSVPKSPAFTALGVTPENLIRPTTPKQLATSLLSGADPRGNIQTGLALETAPYLLIGGNEVTLADYIGSRPIQIASRTQFSL